MKVITAQEALKDYARYAVVDGDGKTCGLHWDIDEAKAVASKQNELCGCEYYKVAVIA